MTTYIPGAIRLQRLAAILQSLLLARPDLSEAIGLVAIAVGLGSEAGARQIVIQVDKQGEVTKCQSS